MNIFEQHTLRDGSRILLRPLEPDDSDVVREVFAGLGPDSRKRRFLVPKDTLTTADVRMLTAVDHLDHEAVAAVSFDHGSALGIARIVRDGHYPGTAEVSVAVVDAWQARGLGTLLMHAIVARARELGIRRFSVFMTHGNAPAARLLRAVLGDVAEVVAVDRGTLELSVPLGSAGRVREVRVDQGYDGRALA